MTSYEGRIFRKYFASVNTTESESIQISIVHYDEKKTFSIELNETNLSSNFSRVGKNPKKVIYSICIAAFKQAEKSFDGTNTVQTDTFTFGLSFEKNTMILYFSRIDPNGFDDPIAWEIELQEENIPFEESILQELKMLRESTSTQSITTIASTGSFCSETSCSINVPKGTYSITASFVCKDTASTTNFWVYYDITVNGESLLQTNTGHYVPITNSNLYPYQVTLHTATPDPIEGTITLVTKPWQNTQYGSLVLTVIPTIIN